MTQKFKVGDKVRILDVGGIAGAISKGFKYDDKTEVYEVNSCGFFIKRSDGISIGLFNSEEIFVELIPQKTKKSERISALEAQVVELTAKVEALEKAQKPAVKFSKIRADFSPNEQRKAIIAEAKTFIEDAKTFIGNCSGRKGYKYASTNRIVCDVEFHVNAGKRTVVALLKYQYGGYVVAKGIAKCAPDDVFNVDIGKAIALGRALGLDVKRFEQAVKPTVAIGQLIKHKDRNRAVYRVNTLQGDLTITNIGGNNASAYGGNLVKDAVWYVITDDTEAKY